MEVYLFSLALPRSFAEERETTVRTPPDDPLMNMFLPWMVLGRWDLMTPSSPRILMVVTLGLAFRRNAVVTLMVLLESSAVDTHTRLGVLPTLPLTMVAMVLLALRVEVFGQAACRATIGGVTLGHRVTGRSGTVRRFTRETRSVII